MENNPEDRWVSERLAALDPPWRPDIAQARAGLDAKLTRRPRSWKMLTAAAVLCVLALALPAQKLWERLVLNRVEIVRIDLSKLPLKSDVSSHGPEVAVKDVDEAEQKAGFRPNLPVGGDVSLKVIAPISVRQTIHTKDIALAPAEWNGLTLRAEIGPIVMADYPDAQILQSRPIELFLPSGFDLVHFMEVILRNVGVPLAEANAMGRKFAAQPAWLLDIPADEAVNVQEVNLRAGPGLLIQDERVTIIFSAHDRVYAVSSPSREATRKLADSLP